MIEAVNSVIATAQLVRASAGQVDAARSFAANPDRVQEVSQFPQAPYLSQSIFMDVNFDQAVIRLRDSETGDVLGQIPSEGRLEARQREQVATNIVFQTTARQVAEYANVAQQSAVPVSTAQTTPTVIAAAETSSSTTADTSSGSTGSVSVLA